MYDNFKTMPTRSQYHNVLAETIEFFEADKGILPEGINEHVLEQLNDIYQLLDNHESLGDTEDIEERYDIGAIAVNFIEDGTEAQRRLFDVFWGIIHYVDMPDL